MRFRLYGQIRTFLRQDEEYMRDNRVNVRDGNNRMLRLSCMIYLAILTFYTALVSLTEQSPLLLNLYLAFDAAHVALCLAVFLRSPANLRNFRATQGYCAALEIALLAFFAVEAVFPFPETHSLYIPIAIMLIVIAFNHGARYIVALTISYLGLYVVLSWLVKRPEVFANDLRVALATLFSVFIGYAISADLRHREYAANKELARLNQLDSLTGVYNRAAMEALCDARLREHPAAYAFMIIDVDNFKRFNDSFGHDAGDQVLRAMGRLLREQFGANDCVGRFGGDEFLVLTETSGRAAAESKTRDLLAGARRLTFDFGDEHLSCSVGAILVSTGPNRPAERFADLFPRADKALYAAKNAGKNRCVID